MNRSTIIDGHRYTWVESLATIGSESEIVICQSESGVKFACPAEIWEAHEENEASSYADAKIKSRSSSSEKITLFRSSVVAAMYTPNDGITLKPDRQDIHLPAKMNGSGVCVTKR